MAIYYKKMGYGVLVEKYTCKNHPRKQRILDQYLTPQEIQFLKGVPHLPPDLFVCRGDQYIFVEVKKDGDSLWGSQEWWFEKIEKKLRCPIHICFLKRRG